jgi:hypothetical protein
MFNFLTLNLVVHKETARLWKVRHGMAKFMCDPRSRLVTLASFCFVWKTECKYSHPHVKDEKDRYTVNSGRVWRGGGCESEKLYSWRRGSDGVVIPYHRVFNLVPVCNKRIPVGNLEKGHGLRFFFYFYSSITTKSKPILWHTQLETARSMTFILCR